MPNMGDIMGNNNNDVYARLRDAGYSVADDFRNGRWPNRDFEDWDRTWHFLVSELRGRCPGFNEEEYNDALEKGFVDSR